MRFSYLELFYLIITYCSGEIWPQFLRSEAPQEIRLINLHNYTPENSIFIVAKVYEHFVYSSFVFEETRAVNADIINHFVCFTTTSHWNIPK